MEQKRSVIESLFLQGFMVLTHWLHFSIGLFWGTHLDHHFWWPSVLFLFHSHSGALYHRSFLLHLSHAIWLISLFPAHAASCIVYIYPVFSTEILLGTQYSNYPYYVSCSVGFPTHCFMGTMYHWSASTALDHVCLNSGGCYNCGLSSHLHDLLYYHITLR